MTNTQIMRLVPKAKRAAIMDVYQDEDGIWITLNPGWNADNTDYPCRTIHCGGEGETDEATREDLKYQISGIRRVEG